MNCQNRVLILTILALACFDFPAQAQQRVKRSDPNLYYRAPHTLTGKMIVLPIGTTFEGRLSQTISSARSHAGESFSLILSSPVLSNGIDVIIPAGAHVIGEVVEAVPSHSMKKQRHMPPPRGKLRVQINQLRTPDGTSFPLVANLVGEEGGMRGGRSNLQTPLGSGVGYVGTAESFESVAPGSNRYGKQYSGQSGRGPEKEYVHKRQFLADEIYGTGDERFSIEDRRIRSLVLRKSDLYIDAGSPLTVRLAAPLRLSVSPVNSGVPVGTVEDTNSADDKLPAPSPKSPGTDIPPITGNSPEAGLPLGTTRPRSQPAAETATPVQKQPAAPANSQPAAPPLSPASDF